jgi:hypothetical protein
MTDEQPVTATDVPPVRMADVVTSLIRTWVPIGVGAFLTWVAASRHIGISPHASAAVGAAMAAALSAGWYALARLLERGGRPVIRTIGRYMLGGVVPPIYVTAAQATRILR